MKKVSILIITWNGRHHLEMCLSSVKNLIYPNIEIIVVDNGSTDDSIEFLRKNYPEVKIVHNKTNLGFAGGNNAGIKVVTGEFLLLLNNDTKVTRTFVTEMIKVIEVDEEIGAVQAKTLSMDDPRKLDSIGAFLTGTGFLYHYGYLQKDMKKFDRRINLYTAKGACMMIRKSVIDKIGLFDNDFFAYFEETDFCHRLWLAGYSIKYVPEAVIYHKIGGTSNKMNNSFIQFHSFKNRICSYLKNLGTKELIIILPVHLILCETAALGFILKGRPDLFVSINKAITWNVMNLPSTMKKRYVIQRKLRKKSDGEIMPIIKKSPEFKYYYFLFAKSLVGYKDNLHFR